MVSETVCTADPNLCNYCLAKRTSISQRLIGRRREIFQQVQKGNYRDWIVREYQANNDTRHIDSLQLTFRRFQDHIRAIRKNWLVAEQDLVKPPLPVDDIFTASLTNRWMPEHRVWGAVLLRAIYDVVIYTECETPKSLRRMGTEALAWINSDEDYIGSFVWICSILSVAHHERIRERIKTLIREELPRQCASAKKKSKNM